MAALDDIEVAVTGYCLINPKSDPGCGCAGVPQKILH